LHPNGARGNWIGSKSNGIYKDTLDRAYIIVMENKAFESARTKFTKRDSEPIFTPFYHVTTGKPLGLSQPDTEKLFEGAFKKLLDDLAKRIVRHTADTSDQPSPPMDSLIMIGIVPLRLKELRRELAKRLQAKVFSVDLVTRDQLKQDAEGVRSRARESRFFIMPFDFGEVEFERGDDAGGHLSRQAALLAETGVTMKWWCLAEAEDEENPETDEQHVKYLKKCYKYAIRGSLETLTAALFPQKRICRVLLEYNQIDRMLIENNLKPLLERRWRRGDRSEVELTFNQMNWEALRQSES
jgi:hypothetical protein